MNLKHEAIKVSYWKSQERNRIVCFSNLLVLNLTFELKISLSSFIITGKMCTGFSGIRETSSLSHMALFRNFVSMF